MMTEFCHKPTDYLAVPCQRQASALKMANLKEVLAIGITRSSTIDFFFFYQKHSHANAAGTLELRDKFVCFSCDRSEAQ